MKTISYWASKHKWQTRFIIVMIYVMLNVIGIVTGKLLTDLNVVLPEVYFICCILFTIALWIGYPTRKAAFTKRKLFDFSLGAVTFLMILYIGNNWKDLGIKAEAAQASRVVPKTKVSLTNNPLLTKFVASLKSMDVSKLSSREKAKIIKNQIKAIKHDKATSKSDKTLLIILSIIVAIALLFGLAALSCSISCGGSEALALIVFLGGTALLIFLLLKVIKRINHPKPKPKEE